MLLPLPVLAAGCSSTTGAGPTTATPPATSSGRPVAVASPPPGALVIAVVGDYGGCAVDCSEEQKVADMVHSWAPRAIISVGDNAYDPPDKSAADMLPYAADIAAGRFLAALGNEDYGDNCSQATVAARLAALHQRDRHFVSTLGAGLLDVFVADTECGEPDGFTPGSAQAVELKAAVARSIARWRVVVGHRPPYSSGPSHGNPGSTWLAPPGTDLVLSGHDHNFEELVAGGMHYVIDGAGGHGLHPQCQPACAPQSVWRDDSHFGAVRLTITQSRLLVEYVAVGGAVLHSFALTR